MAQAVDFQGTNTKLLGGREDIADMDCFRNGTCVVSCWEVSEKELEEIVRTRRVWVSVFSGLTSPPICVGSQSVIRSVVVDYGEIW